MDSMYYHWDGEDFNRSHRPTNHHPSSAILALVVRGWQAQRECLLVDVGN